MKKCSIWANPILVYACFGLNAIYAVACIWMWMEPECRIVSAILAVCNAVAMLSCTPRWGVRLMFTKENILYKPLFRKAKVLEYSSLPRTVYAYYMHGNMLSAYKVHFFVLTNKRLNREELSNINEVAQNDELIKIRYTHRTYKRIISAVPPPLAVELEVIYSTYIQNDSFHIYMRK